MYCGVELLGHVVVICLVFKEASRLFSTVLCGRQRRGSVYNITLSHSPCGKVTFPDPCSSCQGESESCSVVSDSLQPMDYAVLGILQARILAWVAFPFSMRSSQPRD